MFRQVFVKCVQVLGAQIYQLDMANPGVDPDQQTFVPLYGEGFDSGSCLQIQNILSVLSEGLTVVNLIALLNAPLKISNRTLEGLLLLSGRHARLRLPGHPVTYLIPV